MTTDKTRHGTMTRLTGKLLPIVVAVFLGGSANCATADLLYGVVAGSATSGALGGHVVTIDPLTGIATDLGLPIAGTGLTGLAVDSTGRLLATTSVEGGPARLIEIDPVTGGLVSVIAPLTFAGSPQAVTDLAFDPISGKLYANSAFGAFSNNELLEVNMTTGVLTDVGGIVSEGGFKALASSDTGKLYSISTFGSFLYELDASNASTLSTLGLGPAAGIGALGMTVASDGRVFFTDGNDADGGYGRDLWVTDPGSGITTLIGSTNLDANVQDLAFVRTTAVPEPGTLALSVIGLIGSMCLVGRSRKRRSLAT